MDITKITLLQMFTFNRDLQYDDKTFMGMYQIPCSKYLIECDKYDVMN